MKRISAALFGVHHIAILLIAVWVGMVFMAGEALGLFQPDYRRLLFVIILAYWAGVALDLGVLGTGRRRR